MPGGLGRLREGRLQQLQLLGLDGRPRAATFVAVVVFLLVVVVAAIWRNKRVLSRLNYLPATLPLHSSVG